MDKSENSQFTVFVTGADGMLGASICRELLFQGYKVKALVIPGPNNRVISELNLEIVQGNILDSFGLETHMRGCQYVIHVAALTHVWPRNAPNVRKVNIDGALNVASVADKLQLIRMVHIGTASSFKAGTKANPGIETGAFDGDKYQMDYITSKYTTQSALIEKHRKKGFPVIILNPTYMIGPYDSGPSSGKMILEFYKGNVPAYTSGGKNFVSSLDVAKAAVNALRMGQTGECYIVGNENLSFGEFFKKIETVANKKIRMFQVPDFVLFIFGFFNSVVARITQKPPQISYTMARIAACGQYYSPQKARQELGLPQTPVESAIETCLKWYQENGYLTKK